MKNKRSRVVTFFVCVILWLLLTFPPDRQELFAAVLVGLLAALLMGDMFTSKAGRWVSPKRWRWFAVFIAVFIWECIKANFDVAIRILSPRLPINPGIVKVKTSLKSETGLTFLANFITLTPGTFTVDVDKENGYLYIHWIDVKTQDVEKATRIIVSKFERILKGVFE
ncbi:MAG: Na+/H+ antiporter subunit E [Candidatus Omnitrophota bacterium]